MKSIYLKQINVFLLLWKFINNLIRKFKTMSENEKHGNRIVW